jgi:hypothetical protein
MLFRFSLLFFLILSSNVYASRIAAVVNNAVITDIDVFNFAKILCILDDSKSKTCHKDAVVKSIMTIIDSKLKSEYLKKLDIVQDENFANYLSEVIKKTKITKSYCDNNALDFFLFKDYIWTEYCWNMLLAGFARSLKVSSGEVEQYINDNKINKKKYNKEDIERQIIIKKTNIKAEEILRNLRKIYFIEIRM